nr:MAG TPA: hypothetical protein [Caudoviricetes sp.]
MQRHSTTQPLLPLKIISTTFYYLLIFNKIA